MLTQFAKLSIFYIYQTVNALLYCRLRTLGHDNSQINKNVLATIRFDTKLECEILIGHN
jgi:hypothetical protein